MRRIWFVLVVALCWPLACVLLLIDATALWSDELYSVGTSQFQQLAGDAAGGHPSTGLLGLLWCTSGGQSPFSLRLLSWLAYLAGGLVMVRQAMALAQVGARVKVGAVAALLVPSYPIRLRSRGRAMPYWCCWWRWLVVAPFGLSSLWAVAGLAGLTISWIVSGAGGRGGMAGDAAGTLLLPP